MCLSRSQILTIQKGTLRMIPFHKNCKRWYWKRHTLRNASSSTQTYLSKLGIAILCTWLAPGEWPIHRDDSITTSLQGSPNDPGRPPVPGVCSHPPATHCDLPASSRRHPVGTIASMHVPEPAASGASKSPCVWTTFLQGKKLGIFQLLFYPGCFHGYMFVGPGVCQQ